MASADSSRTARKTWRNISEIALARKSSTTWRDENGEEIRRGEIGARGGAKMARSDENEELSGARRAYRNKQREKTRRKKRK